MLLELYREHNKEFLEQTGKTVRMPSYIKHLTAYNHLQDYIKLKCNGREDIFLSEVNSSFVNGFFTYLLTKMQNNSAIGDWRLHYTFYYRPEYTSIGVSEQVEQNGL